MSIVHPPRRAILVHWRDTHGRVQTVERLVFWARGFGHYVKHNRRVYLVDPEQTSLTIGDAAPSAPDPSDT